MKYKTYLDRGEVKSQAELARKLGVSRAKVTQMLNLLNLDEGVQEFMLGLDDTDAQLKVLTERRLRRVSKIIDSKHQKDEFVKIMEA